MKSSSVLIVGCGDLGNRTAAQLMHEGWTVTGVRRTTNKLREGIVGRSADYTEPGSLSFAEKMAPDYVLATFNPFDRSQAGYVKGFQTAMANLLEGLGSHRPRQIIMSSSTRVFAEREGGWIDEHSALTREDAWAQAIISAEQQLLQSEHNAAVVRFAGIYGIPGGRLLSRIRRGELCPQEPLSYTNRIHREDCGGFLAHLFMQANNGRQVQKVYIGVDDCPAPRFEVESWLAAQMGLDPAALAAQATLEQPTQHNRSGHRRCSNKALRDSGYVLRYPDYKSGYGELLADN